VERETIAAALERNAWHRERTAKQLGITRRTLLNKIKEYGIERSPR
jgi:two-component system response regulator AtoC